MAITVYGVPPTINAAKFGKLLALQAKVQYPHGVDTTGLVPSAATGTRLMQVTAGDGIVGGFLVESSATEQVTLDANSSGNDRIDVLVLEVDAAGSPTTGGTVKAVKGTAAVSPVVPSLTQTPGGIYQLPLAQIIVRNGVGQIAAADVTDIRPWARVPFAYRVNPSVVTRSLAQTNDITSALVQVADPGWPYRLECIGHQNFVSQASGIGVASITINTVELASGRTNQGFQPPAIVNDWSTVRTGACVVRLTVAHSGMSSPSTLTTASNHSNFTVVVHPA